jgi:hypothetical protein
MSIALNFAAESQNGRIESMCHWYEADDFLKRKQRKAQSKEICWQQSLQIQKLHATSPNHGQLLHQG